MALSFTKIELIYLKVPRVFFRFGSLKMQKLPFLSGIFVFKLQFLINFLNQLEYFVCAFTINNNFIINPKYTFA